MRIFIWERVEHATTSYHPEGGIAVVARSLEEARGRLREGHVPEKCEAFSVNPDYEYRLDGEGIDPTVILFPDSGCC